MALNASGQISFAGSTTGQSIALELGKSATATISLNDTDVRNLLGVATGQISINSAYGKSSGPGGNFTLATPIIYNFSNTADSFTGSNATITTGASSITVTPTANDPAIRRVVSFSGASYFIIRIGITRTGGSTWDGSLYYTTGGHVESESFKNLMTEPTWDGSQKEITVDMRSLVAGGNDWITNTITGIRFDFGALSNDTFVIDYIRLDGLIVVASGLYGIRYTGDFTGATAELDNVNFASTFTPSGTVSQLTTISITTTGQTNYSWEWKGYFLATTTGAYTFRTTSDDASYLWIGSTAVSGFSRTNATVNNGGPHGAVTVTGSSVTLEANNYYPIRIIFGQGVGGDSLLVEWDPPPTPPSQYTSNGSNNFYYNVTTNGF